MTDTETMQRHLDSAKSIRTWLIQQRDKQEVFPAARAGIRSELSKLNQVIERIEQEQKRAAKKEADEAQLLDLAKQLTHVRHVSEFANPTSTTVEQVWNMRTRGQREAWLKVAKAARDLVADGVPQQITIDGNPVELSRLGHVGRIVIDRDAELTEHVDPARRLVELGEAAVKAIEGWPKAEGAQPW